MFHLTADKWIRLSAITLVIDRGFTKTGRRVRIYTTDGRHEYDLTNEEYTRFMHLIQSMGVGR
jgi:hypothetical protein